MYEKNQLNNFEINHLPAMYVSGEQSVYSNLPVYIQLFSLDWHNK